MFPKGKTFKINSPIFYLQFLSDLNIRNSIFPKFIYSDYTCKNDALYAEQFNEKSSVSSVVKP